MSPETDGVTRTATGTQKFTAGPFSDGLRVGQLDLLRVDRVGRHVGAENPFELIGIV